MEDALLSPGSYDAPIPIMVGGTGPKRTLKTLAMYGDVMNLDGWAGGGMALDYYRHKAGILDQHCENVGRDPSEIRSANCRVQRHRAEFEPMDATPDREPFEGH